MTTAVSTSTEAPLTPADQLAEILDFATARIRCPHASLTAVCGGWLRTSIASDRVGADLDAAQYEFDLCSASDYWGNAEALCSHDLALDTHCPQYSQFAIERGVRSLLICRYAASRQISVTLSLYSDQVAAFNANSSRLCHELAASAASIFAAPVDPAFTSSASAFGDEPSTPEMDAPPCRPRQG